MALTGIKVIEIAGIAPAPFCGLILSDFGAEVLRIDKPYGQQSDCLTRGKKSMFINIKTEKGRQILRELCETADVLIEPFRAGVMERLELGPQQLMQVNPRLIYARLSGYGQTGPMASKAGHDINYLAVSGILSRLGDRNAIQPPLNILGDFAGGGLTCALGICLAIIERSRSGRGQVVDASIVEGASYVSSWIWNSMDQNYGLSPLIWPNVDKPGANTLDGAAPFYRCYRTKDGKFMAVGALEPQFWANFARITNFDQTKYDRLDFNNWPEVCEKIQEIFSAKTQAEWITLFASVDACVTPVLELSDAQHFEHNMARNSFFADGTPRPSPVLSRTPARPPTTEQTGKLNTMEELIQIGYSIREINELESEQIIQLSNESHL